MGGVVSVHRVANYFLVPCTLFISFCRAGPSSPARRGVNPLLLAGLQEEERPAVQDRSFNVSPFDCAQGDTVKPCFYGQAVLLQASRASTGKPGFYGQAVFLRSSRVSTGKPCFYGQAVFLRLRLLVCTGGA